MERKNNSDDDDDDDCIGDTPLFINRAHESNIRPRDGFLDVENWHHHFLKSARLKEFFFRLWQRLRLCILY